MNAVFDLLIENGVIYTCRMDRVIGYNWTIGVVSEKGEGSAFWVELPCRVKPIEK